MNISNFEKIKKKYEDDFKNGFFYLFINNLDKPWNWYYISKNTNITWNIIKNNLDKPWDWYYISGNENITWEIIQNNPDKPWDWYKISSCQMSIGKQIWIKNKVKIEILKKISYKILCNIFDNDICELIINYI